MPTEEEGRQERVRAERGLREATDQWAEVHDVSKGLERARRERDPDQFIADLAEAWKPRHRRHREGPT